MSRTICCVHGLRDITIRTKHFNKHCSQPEIWKTRETNGTWSSLGSGQQTNRREEAGVATLDHARQQKTKYNALRGFLTWQRVAIWSGAGQGYHCIPTACWGEFVCSKVQEITRYHYLGWGARSGASHLIANGLISGHLWRGDIRYYTTV